MKKIIQKFYLFLTVFTVTVMSCQKDSIEPVMELTIDSKQKVLTVEKNGVGIEFCLLNENGEPATIFNEGEDFRFHLAITNNVEPDTAMYMPICLDCGGYIPDKFYVMNAQGDTIGRPFYFRGIVYIKTQCPVINKWDSFILDIPWTESRENWYICTLIAHGSKNKLLPKGEYYTSFVHKFCLNFLSLPPISEKPDEFICTDNISFKINFKIK
ncbi:hypothetical protein ES705_26877 [subsurface metagenome]